MAALSTFLFKIVVGTSAFDSAVERYSKEKFDIIETRKNAAFMFVNFPAQLEFPRPSLSKIIHLGGIQCEKDWKNISVISEEMNTRIFDSKGVILLSFGHHMRWKDAPGTVITAFVRALNRMKDYLVIWKIDIDRPSGLQKHVITANWVPQAQILRKKLSLTLIRPGIRRRPFYLSGIRPRFPTKNLIDIVIRINLAKNV